MVSRPFGLNAANPRTVKDRMAQLEARKEELEAQLARGEDVKSRWQSIWPRPTASIALAHEDSHAEAAALIRTLLGRIVLTPKEEDERQTLSIDLEGALAGVLALAVNDKTPLQDSGSRLG